jgi:preprotein translocase subunit SecE
MSGLTKKTILYTLMVLLYVVGCAAYFIAMGKALIP